MRRSTSALFGVGAFGLALVVSAGQAPGHPTAPAWRVTSVPEVADTVVNAVVAQYCARCHSERMRRGNLVLEGFDVAQAPERAEVAEKMIRKLRAGMMPPAGARRPDEETLRSVAVALEERIDAADAARPHPGTRTFQRLNRAEYERAVLDLLGLEIDAGEYLPLDTKSANFDNIADVQLLSPTLMESYLHAAAEVARMAVGDPTATPSEKTYTVSRYASQREHVEGAPFGTRGGIAVLHNFTTDGEYIFKMSFQHESTGNLFGQTAPFEEQIEISIDGERVALLDIDRWMHVQDPNGVNLESEPIRVTAGPHRVAAAFIQRFEGPLEDLMSPHEWSLADKKIGYSYGITSLPHLQDLVVSGPYDPTGVSETSIRARIFTCRPEEPADARPCAEAILTRIAARAYRRPLDPADVEGLLGVYDAGAAEQGFEYGVRTGLQAILASPDFVFRFEEATGPVRAGEPYRISDIDLASRLAFFLWAAPPDEELLDEARAGRLSDPEVLEAQVRRMLADPRSEALATRFAAQWLRLQDLDKVHPDAIAFPDFHEQLAEAMRRETELLFDHLVREDRDVLELLTADYTFVNERLAQHYGIPGVAGGAFRRVEYPSEVRRGLLGHGSILTLTSHANRTSPVLRGKWVMEVLLGTPPPPPPPDVPDLEATEEAAEGRLLTVRERLEEHRSNPTCNSCHRMMDPIGLALENFDVTGAWRIKDQGVPIEVEGELYDGTPLHGPADLRAALLRRPEAFLRTFTENLVAYAVGRRLDHRDMPTVRAIVSEASTEGNRLSAYVLGIVKSPAFTMKTAEGTEPAEGGGG